MTKIHDLKSYTIKEGDKFFFDTNIWMYMHCSIGSYNEKIVQEYSEFYQKVKTSNNPILTSTLLLSEFINAYSRLEFNIIKKRDGLRDFKRDFRDKEKYQDIFENINLLTKRKLLSGTTRIQDMFESFEEEAFFGNSHTYDFNDEYYCYLAEKKGFKIVTNDSDFLKSNYDIEIITRQI